VVARRIGVKNITVYNATTDPNHLLGRQGEYTSKVNWGQDRGNGNVFSSMAVFPDAADAQLRYTYLRAFRPPLGDGYDYLYRAAILRLASIYTPAQAAALKASFERACKGASLQRPAAMPLARANAWATVGCRGYCRPHGLDRIGSGRGCRCLVCAQAG
jgi:hypothetical protein